MLDFNPYRTRSYFEAYDAITLPFWPKPDGVRDRVHFINLGTRTSDSLLFSEGEPDKYGDRSLIHHKVGRGGMTVYPYVIHHEEPFKGQWDPGFQYLGFAEPITIIRNPFYGSIRTYSPLETIPVLQGLFPRERDIFVPSHQRIVDFVRRTFPITVRNGDIFQAVSFEVGHWVYYTSDAKTVFWGRYDRMPKYFIFGPINMARRESLRNTLTMVPAVSLEEASVPRGEDDYLLNFPTSDMIRSRCKKVEDVFDINEGIPLAHEKLFVSPLSVQPRQTPVNVTPSVSDRYVVPYRGSLATLSELKGRATKSAVQQAKHVEANGVEFISETAGTKEEIQRIRSLFSLRKWKKRPLSQLSSVFLSYRYGIRLTVADLKEYWKGLHSETRSRITADEQRYQTLRGREVIQPHRGPGDRYYTISGYVTSIMKIHPPTHLLRKAYFGLDSWGFYPTTSRMWDLLPLSFVADWFTNTQELLEQIDNLTAYNMMDIGNYLYTTRIVHETVLSGGYPQNVLPIKPPDLRTIESVVPLQGETSWGLLESVSYERILHGKTYFDIVQSEAHGTSIYNWVTGISLLL